MSTSFMGPGSRYAAIPAEDLILYLQSKGLHETQPYGKERVFSLNSMIGKMPCQVIFLTSLSVNSDMVREVGKDAMRLWVIGQDAVGKEHKISINKRFYRTQGWKRNIGSVIDHWQLLVKHRCFSCHSPLTFVNRPISKKMECTFCLPSSSEDHDATTNQRNDSV